MRKSLLWLRLNRLSVTVLYEGGGRQQVTVPAPCSGRIQRWKEIPEATENMVGHRRGQIHGRGDGGGGQ